MIQLTLLARTKTGYRPVGDSILIPDSDFAFEWSAHNPRIVNYLTIRFPQHRGKPVTVTHVAFGPPHGLAVVCPLTVPLDMERRMIASFPHGALSMNFDPTEERIFIAGRAS